MVKASVIIPTLNRSAYLKTALKSIIEQTADKKAYELIVVDNGSTDKTKKVTKQIATTHPACQIRYVCEPEPGLLAGRHRGLKEARGKILVFIDDDIIVNKDWLPTILKAFKDPSIHLVGGPSLPIYQSKPPLWLESFWSKNKYGRWCGYLSLLDFGKKIRQIDPAFVFGLNFSTRKKTLLKLGGFHPDLMPENLKHFQGDGETGLTVKIRKKGLKAIYHPAALVWHQIPRQRMSINYFEKRSFFQGICDSFAQIRKNKNYKKGPKLKKRNTLSKPLSYCLPSKAYNFFLNLFFQKPKLNTEKPRLYTDSEIKKRDNKAYKAGFSFHQNEVAKNPKLLEWVLKKDYFNYKIPELEK